MTRATDIHATVPRAHASAVIAAIALWATSTAQADLTDLATQPLANVSGTVAVKPNVMFILDDSGSMQWDFVPDHVDNSNTSLAPKYTGKFGDPPYTSPHFNKQYYNPEINYLPPVGYDGGTAQGTLSLLPQNADNTTNWTSVRTDGFNKQNKDQLGVTTNYVNLVTGYPDRVYCTAKGDSATDTAKCKTNNSGFIYADGYSSLATDPYTVGLDTSDNVKYRTGGPYYFNILPGEYCSDEALTTCVSVTPGDSAPVGYPYPARVRWCNSSTAAKAATPTAGTCQGKWLGSFTVPRFGSSAAAVVASGTITIGDSGSNDSVGITNIKINNVSVINTTVTASGGTNTSSERQSLATAVANAINSYNSTPDYRACAGSGCDASPYSAYGLGTVDTNKVVIIPVTTVGGTTPVTDNSRAGYAIEVVAPSSNTSYASGTVTISSLSSTLSTGKFTSITVGPPGGPFVEVLNNSLGNFGTNSNTNRENAIKATRDRINAYANTSPWEYTARYNTACGGQSASKYRVCIDAPLSAGAQPNGFVINVTAVNGVSSSTTTFSGGQSRQIPTTTTSITAGAGVVTPFQRVDIVPTRATYPRASTRVDCVTTANVCTYAEEMTNFANWYAYYRTRNQAMKTAAGRAFLPLSESYRVGFNTINKTSGFTSDAAGSTNWLPVLDYTSSHKNNWYTKLYAASGTSATPLRGALNRIGKYFQGTLSGADSPIQYSCQQNFSILTTDGYWNETGFSEIGDVDNINDAAQFCTRTNGCYDGGTGATSTLADVALYYYKNDLRPDLADNVPIDSASDPNPAQHMTTFTLGLGIDGVMTYRSDYATATTGDFYRIRTGELDGCAWAAGTCNWPVPLNNHATGVDDLWHAAINGHGKYFSAQDPASLAAGLSGALQGLQIRTGAAAASSTSTPNITQEDKYEFSATFRTVKWDGELVKQEIDITNGATLPAVLWSARAQLEEKVDVASDTRTIYTTAAATPGRREFRWANLSTAEQDWFNNRCAGTGLLAQCVTLGTTPKALANNGEKLLEYLRGQKAMEAYVDGGGDPIAIFRPRDYVLGDIAGSKPGYVAKPKRSYTDAGYADYKTAYTNRTPMVYAGANDGMLHAFNVSDGAERWAYVPRFIMPELYHLANSTYGGNHHYYVDGSPTIADAKISGNWKTLLVGGLNRGGRGFYALDITDPNDPQPLWEICSDSTLCPYRNDADMGYSYGEPIITKRSDGTWVVIVTSGYNNVSPGNGQGYLYVLRASDGYILSKVATGVGDTVTPSGLAKIADYVEDPDTNNTALLVYGGDLLGNLWRFDLSTTTPSKIKLATLSGGGEAQSITARPETGSCGSTKMVYVGTGRYLGTDDVETTGLQTVWGIRDGTAALGDVRLSGANMVEQTLSSAGGGNYRVTNNPVDLTTKNGWFVDLDQNTGERVNLDPVLVNGNLIVVTNQPTSDGSAACGTGGKGYYYQFAYCRGSSVDQQSTTVIGGQIATSIIVGFIPIGLPSGPRLKITTADGGKPLPPPIQQGSTSGTNIRRVSWRELTE